MQDANNCAKGVEGACGTDYLTGGGINWTKIAKTALRTAKSYGFACAVNGGIGALAGGGAGGFAIGCTEGIIDVYAEKHAPPSVAAGLTLITVGRGARKIFIETSLGKNYTRALGQALCAAFYPTCK